MRQLICPSPEDQVDVTLARARCKAWHKNTCGALPTQPLREFPCRWLPPQEEQVFPSTRECFQGDLSSRSLSRVPEIHNIIAINLVGADRQRLWLERKGLLGFEPRRFHV